MTTEMKLYVWEDVFCDYTCGIAFAIAPNKEAAIKAACDRTYQEEELRAKKPRVFKLNRETPIGFHVYGGG